MVWLRKGAERAMVSQASRLQNVRYDIRGPVLRRARQLEAAGHDILKLNIGNPAAFGIGAPDAVLRDVVRSIGDAQGYSDARGIYSARVAVAQYYQTLGVIDVQPDDVFLGNRVSELIVMSLQALLSTGDEVLVPSPDYPLWTGAVTLCGGRPVHYRCDESQGWQPDLAGRPGLRAFVAHGRRDPVMEVEFGRRAHAQLEAGERGAEAEVPSAGAECLVVGFAAHVEAIGVLEARLVTVGRDVPHDHLVSLLDLLPVQLGVARRGAPEVRERGKHPQ